MFDRSAGCSQDRLRTRGPPRRAAAPSRSCAVQAALTMTAPPSTTGCSRPRRNLVPRRSTPGGRTGIRIDRTRADQAMARIENRADLTDHGDPGLRAAVLDLAEVALAALSPSAGLRRSVALDGEDLVAAGGSYDVSAADRLVLLGAGKATAGLAAAFRAAARVPPGRRVVVVPYPADQALSRVSVLPGEHPVPPRQSTPTPAATSVAAGSAYGCQPAPAPPRPPPAPALRPSPYSPAPLCHGKDSLRRTDPAARLRPRPRLPRRNAPSARPRVSVPENVSVPG
jgi:hypothetical protein